MVDRSGTDRSAAPRRGASTRRSVLLGAATALGGGLVGARPGRAAESPSITEEQRTLRPNTRYETPAYVLEAPKPGKTAVVLGGVHGSERAGIDAAHRVREWTFDRGTLIVVPEANAPAVRDETYVGPDGDLNQQFPPAGRPTTPIAEAIWTLVDEADPAAVVDLHSSMGIWDSPRGPDGFGQAIFPSAAGEAREIASRTARSLTDARVRPAAHATDDYEFTLGNTLAGAHPRLIHKVSVDLERAGYLVEVTRHGTDLDTRTAWAESLVAELLENHEFDVTLPEARAREE
ncbi:succinylglutamate desuccinylase/aspartoacylase family protein [Natronococcus jeotgali]|uniref:Succinylglutamate desuccinylase/Aspartoacylase catalytic domain-containing protein n=1 Tax=Natronococcus jeotgali DSM 18795 TaxID=1227498 RepID=L9X3R3_9EURY|nr:succinylglutamate desuccinylase/aspartoacylase family protein [Natronococcus jeotgali]ELY56404.1 hypothetical protein C492_14921 [Natronococcus jeotgali DSM 18795]